MIIKETKAINETKNYINILKLPTVLKLEIFKYLPPNSIVSCAKTCKDFNAIIFKSAKSESLWKHIYSRLNPSIQSTSQYTYLERCKNFTNYINNIKEGKYTHQVILTKEGDALSMPNSYRIYQGFKENKVEIFDTVFGESEILDVGKHENYIFGSRNRLLTYNTPLTPEEVQTIKLWNTRTKAFMKEFDYNSTDGLMKSSADCIVFISNEGKLSIINTKLEKQFQINVPKKIMWSLLKGNFLELVLEDLQIMLINITTGKLTEDVLDPKGCCPLAFENYLLKHDEKKDSIDVYEIESKKYLHTLHLDEPYKFIDFELNENLLITCYPGKNQFWNLKEGKCVQTLSYEGNTRLSNINNGHLIIETDRGEAIVWNILTGKCLAKFFIPNNTHIKSIRLLDNFIICSYGSNKITIWDFQGKVIFSHSKNDSVKYSRNSLFGHLLISQYTVLENPTNREPYTDVTEIIDFNNNPLSLLYATEQKKQIFEIYYTLIKNKIHKDKYYLGCGEDAFMKKANFKDFDSNDKLRHCAIGLHTLETTLKIDDDVLKATAFKHLPTNLQEALKKGFRLFEGTPEIEGNFYEQFSLEDFLNSTTIYKVIIGIKENGLDVISPRVKEEIINLQSDFDNNLDNVKIKHNSTLVSDKTRELIFGHIIRINKGEFPDQEEFMQHLPTAVKNLSEIINY